MTIESRQVKKGDKVNWFSHTDQKPYTGTVEEFVNVNCCGKNVKGVRVITDRDATGEWGAYISLEHIVPDVNDGEWKAVFSGHIGARKADN